MTVIGLTGMLGSGKTTVAEMFADCGAKIICADKITHDFLNRKGCVHTKVVKAFPDACVGGYIDKQRLAECVFYNARALSRLEKIIHPAVEVEIKKQLRRLPKKAVVILDVPLLFEAGLDALCDWCIVVKSNQALSVSRIKARAGMRRKDVVARLKRQMPQKEKIQCADEIIDNRFSRVKTRAQVRHVWKTLVRT